jgi:hypothetical protein
MPGVGVATWQSDLSDAPSSPNERTGRRVTAVVD